MSINNETLKEELTISLNNTIIEEYNSQISENLGKHDQTEEKDNFIDYKNLQNHNLKKESIEMNYQIKEKDNTSDFKLLNLKIKNKKLQLDLERKFPCSVENCKYAAKTAALLVAHSRSHSNVRPHKCTICEKSFKTMLNLKNHVNAHVGHKPHRCKYYRCKAKFVTSGELIRHVKYVHTQEKEFHCPECDYSSVEKSKMMRHMTVHTGARPYQCEHCSYASSDNFKLKRHLRIHTGERPYKCDLCPSAFAQQNALKVHRLVHTGKKVLFKCPYCPTTLGRKVDVRNHVDKQHTPIGPIFCDICNQSFNDRYSMRMHKKSHSGEKCFKCSLCPFQSASRMLLIEHTLVHTGVKPFKCDLCNKSFRIKQLLKRHYISKHGCNQGSKQKTYNCTECGKLFHRFGNLKNHLLLHTKSLDTEIEFSNNNEQSFFKKEAYNTINLQNCSDDNDKTEPSMISNYGSLKIPNYDSTKNRSNSIECDMSNASSPNLIDDDVFQFSSSTKHSKCKAISPNAAADRIALEQRKQELASCFGFETEDEE